jgi:hypothetical protein
MPYTPFANTDQGLVTLGKALFPDPAVIAQTGYYGAAQREKMLSGNKIMGEQALTNNWIHRLDPRNTVHFVRAPSGSPVGAPPIPATDEGTPMVGGGTYGASPGAYGAPPPASAPSLSATITQPPSGAAVSDYMNTHPNPATSATPPAQSSPAPNSGAPPAPNTTGSDGSVPNNDAGSAVIHAGTFQAPGGGVKMAPPAQADGSPAPLAFNPTLISALGAAGGINPSALNSTMASYVEREGRQSGVIDAHTADRLSSAFGNTTPLTSTTQVQTNAATVAGGIKQVELQQAGENQRKQMDIAAAVAAARAVPFKYQPGGPGTQVITTTTGKAVDEGLQPFDQASDTAARALVNVQTNGPASPPTSMRQGDVKPGTPVFNQNVYDTATKPISVVDAATKQPATIRYQDYLDAPPGKYIYNPASKEISPLEALQRKSVYNKVVQDAFPGIPQSRASQLGYAQRNEKAVLNPADDVTYTELANQYYTYGPAGVRGDPYAAGQMALKELQQKGVIRRSVDREAHTDIYNPHIVEYQTDKGPVQYFRIPSLQEEAEPLKNTVAPTTSAPATSAPAATPAAPASSGASENPGFLSTLFTNPFNFKGTGGAPAPTAAAPAPAPQAAGATPAGALMAVPNAVENQTGTTRDGTRFIVHGGFAYPVAQPAMQGR